MLRMVLCLSLGQHGSYLEILMDTTAQLNEDEQQKRLHIVELLLPHFGKNTDQLLEAATSVQAHVEGSLRAKPVGIADTVLASDRGTVSVPR
jgi:hypothetical protein